jgi:hypothetical protein
MTDVYAPERSLHGAPAPAPSVLERGQLLRDYMRRRPAGDLAAFLRSEADDDPAALLTALALDVPARTLSFLRRPPSLGLVLAGLVLARRRV